MLKGKHQPFVICIVSGISLVTELARILQDDTQVNDFKMIEMIESLVNFESLWHLSDK